MPFHALSRALLGGGRRRPGPDDPPEFWADTAEDRALEAVGQLAFGKPTGELTPLDILAGYGSLVSPLRGGAALPRTLGALLRRLLPTRRDAFLGRFPVRRTRRLESILSEGLAGAGVDAEAAVPPERLPVEGTARAFLTR